jgi:hypothetical protein
MTFKGEKNPTKNLLTNPPTEMWVTEYQTKMLLLMASIPTTCSFDMSF